MITELLDIFDTVRMLFSTLGHLVFEPIVKPNIQSHLLFVRGGGSEHTQSGGQHVGACDTRYLTQGAWQHFVSSVGL